MLWFRGRGGYDIIGSDLLELPVQSVVGDKLTELTPTLSLSTCDGINI
jgi:hypothetical protein